jgi:hypothetical protein
MFGAVEGIYEGVFFVMDSGNEVRGNFDSIVLLELAGMDYAIDAI